LFGGPTLSRRTAGIALACLVAGGLVLRWFGIGFQLPQFVPVDSLVLAGEVDVLRHGGDPSYRLHPALYPRLIPCLALLLPAEAEESGDPAPATLDEHLARASAPYRRVGIVVALLSLLAVPGTYFLARRFLERSWSLLAAALVATSVLHLWFSQEARPHGAAMSSMLLAVLAALRLRRKPVVSSYLLAGVAAGAAIATLQSGVAVIPAFLAAFGLRARDPPRSSPWWILAALALLGGCRARLLPLDGGNAAARTRARSRAGLRRRLPDLDGARGHPVELRRHGRARRPRVAVALRSADRRDGRVRRGLRSGRPPLSRRSTGRGRAHRDDLLVVLAFAVPYGVVIALYHSSGQRFVLPLLPYLACLSAYGLRALWDLGFARKRWIRRVAVAGLVAALAIQTAAAAKLAWIRHRPDTATEAAAWLSAHVRPGVERVLVTPGLDLPLFQSSDALERSYSRQVNPNRRWIAYQKAMVWRDDESLARYDLVTLPTTRPEDRKLLADPAGYLRAQDADWIVFEVHRTFDWQGIVDLHRVLGEVGELEARFSPDRASRWGDVPIAHQGHDPRPFPVFWYFRILDARCTGSVLEIWKLRR
jgi:hypothetical protein